MKKYFADRANKATVPVHPVAKKALKSWLMKQTKAHRNWLSTAGFSATSGEAVLLPNKDGGLAAVALGLGASVEAWPFASLASKLPKGRYRLEGKLGADEATSAALGWGLGCYAFNEYKSKPSTQKAALVWPTGCDRGEAGRQLEAVFLGRDLINKPAADLGPVQIASRVRALGKKHGAKVRVVTGKVLEKGFPSIHVVGKGAAGDRRPRLCDLTWGRPSHPKVTLVGKGVVFDSGGLDIKSAAGMRLMKKDMGGAASVLALASMIMDAKLKVRLRVLVPTVENSVSAEAFRPGDVINTRKGITVEVGNTDAEGRLILNDALTLASEDEPEIIVDFATLTGAARVALGVELPAFFCTDDADAVHMRKIVDRNPMDPDELWHMPLFKSYRRHLRSSIADISNIDNIGKGGAITAALFLKEFVASGARWIHIDTMAWNLRARPGRPEGGEVLGARTLYRMFRDRYGR